MSVTVITVRYSPSLPSPSKPAPEIVGGGQSISEVERIWNVMAHAQKPDFVFPRNGRVHLNRQGRQFSRLLAAELGASAVLMRDTPSSEVVKSTGYPLHSSVSTSPPVRHRVPSRFNWTLPAEVRLTKQHTVGGGGPLPDALAVRSRERVPSSCPCSASRNTCGRYQTVQCYNSCA